MASLRIRFVTFVLAVDVGGTTIKAEIADESGAVVRVGSVPTPKGAAALDAVAALGGSLIESCDGPVTAAGVIVPGIVDPTRRIAVYSANIGWSDLDAGALLDRAWGIPVAIDHDVTCAGWAEWRTGAGQGCSDMAFVAIGTGISAALVSGGRLLRAGGATGGSRQPGEIGHVVIRPDGPPCGCGARGCVEAVASAAAIARAYSAVIGSPVAGALEVELAAAHDDRARTVWDDAVAALADGLAMLTALLAPERIVLGGGLAVSGSFLLRLLVPAFAPRVCVQPVPELVTARHGMRAGLAGAALLARTDQARTDQARTDEAGARDR
jgi:glucokinase